MEPGALGRALVRGLGAVALCGGAVVAAAGTASATVTSVSDCRDFAEMWGIGEDSSSYDTVHQACQAGAAHDPAQCRQRMQSAIWEHNHDDSQQPVPYWVGDEACRRAP